MRPCLSLISISVLVKINGFVTFGSGLADVARSRVRSFYVRRKRILLGLELVKVGSRALDLVLFWVEKLGPTFLSISSIWNWMALVGKIRKGIWLA